VRVAVVGAGFAGLWAAELCRREGHEVTVLEARERVGGRVHSRRLGNGAVVEMGAEFILPGNTVISELAAELGLGLWDKGMRYGRREPRGGPPVDDAALADALEQAEAALEANPEAAREPTDRFVAGLGLGPGAAEYLLARTEISAASSAALVPAGNLLGVAHIGDDPSPGIAGGNDRIAVELARGLGESVHLGAAARSITRSGGRIVVGTESGELAVDRVVVAVPAAVLDAIRFDPPLPEPLAGALAAVRYGHAAKLFVPLGDRPPLSAVMSVPERYWCWTASGDADGAQPVLSAFAGSAAALERLGVGSGPDRWLESLRRLRPDLDLKAGGAAGEPLLSTWDDDPWARAAYSVSAGGALAELLAAERGPVVFAGEHTAGEFAGLMEGALRSGREAARRICAAG
jgi:monoamine oxidase